MIKFINHHSFLLFLGGAFAALAAYLLRDGLSAADALFLLGAAALTVLTYRRFYAGPSTEEADHLGGRSAPGAPTLIEIQSRY